ETAPQKCDLEKDKRPSTGILSTTGKLSNEKTSLVNKIDETAPQKCDLEKDKRPSTGILSTTGKLSNEKRLVQQKSFEQNKEKQIQLHPMKNVGVTCCMNSVIQALSVSQLSDQLIYLEYENNTINVNQSNIDLAIEGIVKIWRFMKDSRNECRLVPVPTLMDTLNRIVSAIASFTQDAQQDAYEFVRIFNDVALENVLKWQFRDICSSCQLNTVREVDHYSLILHMKKNDSLQTLLNDKFTSESISKSCSGCKQSLVDHDVRDTIITVFPRTLIIHLLRYLHVFDSSGQSTTIKLHNRVHINEQLKIKCANGHYDVCYDFKSAVCHRGPSATDGHYNAVVKVDPDYFCCDDLNIRTIDANFMLPTAYILIFDRKDPELPSYILPFLQCWVETGGVKILLKDPRISTVSQTKTVILQEMSNGGQFVNLMKQIKQSMSLDLVINDIHPAYFFDKFIKFAFYSDTNIKALCHEYLELSKIKIWSCHKCKLVEVKSESISVVSLETFSMNNVLKHLTIMEGEPSMNVCKCSPEPSCFITSLPCNFVIHVQNCKSLTVKQILVIDLEGQLKKAYDVGNMKYNLKSILVQQNGKYIKYSKDTKGMISDKNDILTDFGSVEAYLFYTRSVVFHDPEREVKAMLRKPTLSSAKEIKLLPLDTSATRPLTMFGTKLFGSKLNKEFFKTITDVSGWLTGENINVYMSLLIKHCSHLAYAVDSGWFSQRLVRDGNPKKINGTISKVENKQIWLNYDFIIVPINENDVHWTLIVIDVANKTIIYSDSYGRNSDASYVCYQLYRYLSYEALVHSGIVLNKSEWAVMFYSETPNFPRQTDPYSCGVYVCAVAKAILYCQKLPYIPNMHAYRHLMSTELRNGFI
ncbi:MAG: Ulp1 family isopeptidase, partial [Sedimenticola sp.]